MNSFFMAAILESFNDKQRRHQETSLQLIRHRLLTVAALGVIVCAPTSNYAKVDSLNWIIPPRCYFWHGNNRFRVNCRRANQHIEQIGGQIVEIFARKRESWRTKYVGIEIKIMGNIKTTLLKKKEKKRPWVNFIFQCALMILFHKSQPPAALWI